MFAIGDRVWIKATLFDAKDSNNSWSKSIFGTEWKTAKCYGKIQKLSGKQIVFARVLWDIDQRETRLNVKYLQKEESVGKFPIENEL